MRKKIAELRHRTVQAVKFVGLGIGAVSGMAYLMELAEGLQGDAKTDFLEFIERVRYDLTQLGRSRAQSCHDCGRHGWGYMLKTKIWEQVLTEQERARVHYNENSDMLICLACAHLRLREHRGHGLRRDDFDLAYTINWPILVAIEVFSSDEELDEDGLAKIREKYVVQDAGEYEDDDEKDRRDSQTRHDANAEFVENGDRHEQPNSEPVAPTSTRL